MGQAPRDEPTKIAEIIVPLLGPLEAQEEELANGARVRLSLGALDQDDCAAYDIEGGVTLVAGSDYVRGPKFRLYEMGFMDNYDIGWYLAGANWSDVAAMGALPLGLLSVVRYPRDLLDEEFAKILQGIADCCKYVGARNIGGDVGGAERVILSASAFGVVEPGGVLTRGGASPGDVVCLTGPTGLAGAAMQLAAAGAQGEVPGFEDLLEKWKRVRPRVAHGRIFSLSGAVTSCIDTSDGLKGAIETLARHSGTRFEVHQGELPLELGVRAAASALGADPLALVFGDSVDFELVCTVKPEFLADLEARCRGEGLSLISIGRVVAGAGCVLLNNGDCTPLPGAAWRHHEPVTEPA